ncbi:MAG TPA: nicotinate-nucleotide adenylyltransferase [Acidimicrobiales bacterium]|nr:nicotinate-nucleotide adenylyltransferase [Acidimicrobiales bacterium]
MGVFGGTFDPVHVGHLVAATWARQALELDRVLFVVAGQPWQKVGTRAVTRAEDRYEVVRAAVEGIEGLEASRLEIERPGPSYTADSVRELAAVDPDVALYLIVGADVAADLDSWQRVGEVRDAVTLVVVERAGLDADADPAGWKVERVRIPRLDISSSQLRQRLADGRSVQFLVPDAAIRCILRLGLYAGSR